MNNKVDYFEIGTPDATATRAFYGPLFGWQVSQPSDQGYSTINQSEGGIWDTSSIGGSTWGIFYVHVQDVEATLAQAEALGATVAIPYTSGGGIAFAHLIDPQGNRFGIWRPLS